MSSKKHKIFRFGTNWVTLGLVVQLPCRPDRFFCVNILWRVYTKKTASLAHRTKSQLARDMVEVIASWLPEHTLYVVGDSANWRDLRHFRVLAEALPVRSPMP